MREVKQATAPLSVEEYIQYELHAERRHEFINGQLIEMPGEKAINNRIALFIAVFFVKHLIPKGYQVYNHDVKVAGHDRAKYFYPDIFVTKETENEYNPYIKFEPELIVEVISPSSHITDTVDKYIAYTSIPSLHYYLIVEPETVYVTLYSRGVENKWEVMSYVKKDDVIPLPLLELSLPLSEVYP
jgi:Uma2 family endonuclease